MKIFTEKQLVADTKEVTKDYYHESLQSGLIDEIAERIGEILQHCGVSLDDTPKVNYLISACADGREEIRPKIDLRKIIVSKAGRQELEELIKIITPEEFLWMISNAKLRHDREIMRMELKNIFKEISYKEMDYVVSRLHNAKDKDKNLALPRLKSPRHRECLNAHIKAYGAGTVACTARCLYYEHIQEKVGTQITKFAESPTAGYAAGVRAIKQIVAQKRKAHERKR